MNDYNAEDITWTDLRALNSDNRLSHFVVCDTVERPWYWRVWYFIKHRRRYQPLIAYYEFGDSE